MICPICHQAMRRNAADTSVNPATGKQYDRSHYQCMGDDVWMVLEVPKDHPPTDEQSDEQSVEQ